ncbi:MAG: RsmD family RNA methyltransferase [Treponema sp.]|jgi:16S rRNA (guanine(966)-N(2))-methyltransferase RsmD|nr:RsmD family RNA methyltransferase [Treponema sp.]
MRVSGGLLHGQQVKVPEGVIRPTMDRMRESVFATLGDLSGLSFLDLFSGSGIVALEAVSRGAFPVEAVEKDSLKRKTLLENVAIAPLRIKCCFMAVELYVQRAKTPFNIIFCDPPFPYQFKWELVKAIAAAPLMVEGSRLLIHRPSEEASGFMEKLRLEQSKKYGRSIVDFFIYV